MKLFGIYTFHWWQVGVFKLSLLSLGIIIGAYWSALAKQFVVPLAALFVFSSVYIIIISLKQ